MLAKRVLKTITLIADLSNTNEFPLQLTGVKTPLTGDMKVAVEKVATDHSDAMTRALAHCMLGDADQSIATMAAAIDALGLSGRNLSTYVNFTARFVRAKFESIALANAFTKSQVYGPAGMDGKLGTADDTPNPLTAIQE